MKPSSSCPWMPESPDRRERFDRPPQRARLRDSLPHKDRIIVRRGTAQCVRPKACYPSSHAHFPLIDLMHSNGPTQTDPLPAAQAPPLGVRRRPITSFRGQSNPRWRRGRHNGRASEPGLNRDFRRFPKRNFAASAFRFSPRIVSIPPHRT